jgi:hypothetical protein
MQSGLAAAMFTGGLSRCARLMSRWFMPEWVQTSRPQARVTRLVIDRATTGELVELRVIVGAAHVPFGYSSRDQDLIGP